MTKRRLGPNHYFLWRSQITPFGDGKASLQFLAPFKGDPSGMGDLRRLLVDSHRGIDVIHLTDDQVVAEVSRLIMSGDLLVASDRRWDSGGSTGNAAGAQAAPPPAAAPVRSGPQPPEPEPSTFSNVDGAAQAATLSAAAASGAPFCPH